MESPWRLLAVICTILVSAFLLGCNGSSSSSSHSSASCHNTGEGVDTWTIGGTTYTEGSSGLASASGVKNLCQPLIDAFDDGGDVDAYIAIGITSPTTDTTEVDIFADETIIGSAQTSTAGITYYANGTTECDATVGSVTITQFGANGGRVIGSYSVTSWTLVSGGSCPGTPYSGSFNITRNDFSAFDVN